MIFDPAVQRILEAVPEFVPRYVELVEAADDDPGAPAVFAELAEYVAELAGAVERSAPQLARCLSAVEAVAAGFDDAPELVGWAFLDSLSPDELRVLLPMLGPATVRVLEGLEQGEG